MNYAEKINWLLENVDDIHTYEDMIDFAKSRIDDGYIFVAIHILEALHKETTEYYRYDYGMGTLDSVTAFNENDEEYIDELMSEYK